MATFSVNQVKHLYVVPSASASDFYVKKDKDGALYFGFKDAEGKAVRSDLITNILYSKAITAEKMQRKPKTYKITATDADMFAGQDYIIRLAYTHFIGISDEDNYFEIGCARANKTNDDVEVLLADLAKNLYANTRKQGMVDIKVIVNNVEKSIPDLLSTDVVTDIIIREVEQPWTLGVRQEESVHFNVHTPYISVSGTEMNWATVTDETANQTIAIGNGKTVADMEYFHLGDRADIYRKMGWPNVWPSDKLLKADPTKQYDMIDIHYAYIGSGEAVQKSEKDITLAIPAGTVATPDHTVAAAVLTAINALGVVTIEKPDEW